MTTKEQIKIILAKVGIYVKFIFTNEDATEEIYSLHKQKMIDFAEWVQKEKYKSMYRDSDNPKHLFDLFEQENNK